MHWRRKDWVGLCVLIGPLYGGLVVYHYLVFGLAGGLATLCLVVFGVVGGLKMGEAFAAGARPPPPSVVSRPPVGPSAEAVRRRRCMRQAYLAVGAPLVPLLAVVALVAPPAWVKVLSLALAAVLTLVVAVAVWAYSGRSLFWERVQLRHYERTVQAYASRALRARAAAAARRGREAPGPALREPAVAVCRRRAGCVTGASRGRLAPCGSGIHQRLDRGAGGL